MRILVTGDRDWDQFDRIFEILKQLPEDAHTLIHGAARGVDSLAEIAAKRMNWRIEAYHADWENHGRAAGPVRNQKMVDSKPTIGIAFHSTIASSKGTKDCIVRMRKHSVPVWLVTTDEVLQVVRASKMEVITKPTIWRDVCQGLARLHP